MKTQLFDRMHNTVGPLSTTCAVFALQLRLQAAAARGTPVLVRVPDVCAKRNSRDHRVGCHAIRHVVAQVRQQLFHPDPQQEAAPPAQLPAGRPAGPGTAAPSAAAGARPEALQQLGVAPEGGGRSANGAHADDHNAATSML